MVIFFFKVTLSQPVGILVCNQVNRSLILRWPICPAVLLSILNNIIMFGSIPIKSTFYYTYERLKSVKDESRTSKFGMRCILTNQRADRSGSI